MFKMSAFSVDNVTFFMVHCVHLKAVTVSETQRTYGSVSNAAKLAAYLLLRV